MSPSDLERKFNRIKDFRQTIQAEGDLATSRKQLLLYASDFMAAVKRLPEGELFKILQAKVDKVQDLLESPLRKAVAAVDDLLKRETENAQKTRETKGQSRPHSTAERIAGGLLMLGLGLAGAATLPATLPITGSGLILGLVSLETVKSGVAGMWIFGVLRSMLKPEPRSDALEPYEAVRQELTEIRRYLDNLTPPTSADQVLDELLATLPQEIQDAIRELRKIAHEVAECARTENYSGNRFLLECCKTTRSEEQEKRFLDYGGDIEHLSAAVEEAARALCLLVGVPRPASYTTFQWSGSTHDPTSRQRPCIQRLHEAYLDGTTYVALSDLADLTGGKGKSLADIFKDRKELQDWIVGKDKAKGLYRLTLVPPDERAK